MCAFLHASSTAIDIRLVATLFPVRTAERAFIRNPVAVVIAGIAYLFRWLHVLIAEDDSVHACRGTCPADPQCAGRAGDASSRVVLVRRLIAVVIDPVANFARRLVDRVAHDESARACC